jgi:hypothetical protein
MLGTSLQLDKLYAHVTFIIPSINQTKLIYLLAPQDTRVKQCVDLTTQTTV